MHYTVQLFETDAIKIEGLGFSVSEEMTMTWKKGSS